MKKITAILFLVILVTSGAIFAFNIVPVSLQVYLSGIATCDITDNELKAIDPLFEKTKFWEKPLAHFYRWKQINLGGPMTFSDSIAGDISAPHVLLTASGGTGGKCDKEILELLKHYIEHGAPLNYYDSLGYTALHLAVIFKKANFVRLLLENGANINLKVNNKKSKINGMSSIEIATLFSKKNNSKDLQTIIDLLHEKI